MNFIRSTGKILEFGNEYLFVIGAKEKSNIKYRVDKLYDDTYVIVYNLNNVEIEKNIDNKRFEEIKQIVKERKNYAITK